MGFDATEANIIKVLGLKCKLACRVWGEDSGFNGGDDSLFSLSTKTITTQVANYGGPKGSWRRGCRDNPRFPRFHQRAAPWPSTFSP